MVKAPGIKVAPEDAESMRQRLRDAGVLRDDLIVHGSDGGIVFPVRDGLPDLRPSEYDFQERAVRPRDYTELLPDRLRPDAPRAFDRLGDIVLVKVPKAQWEDRFAIGTALLDFHSGVRAVFHDHGVTGEFRVRDLESIAGAGGTETEVQENGVRLRIDPARAYFSPRLADERARIAGLVPAGERVLDLFGGVAPQGVQLAKKGAEVTSIDLNPDATRLAEANAELNGVHLEIRTMDARDVQGTWDRVVMNLPHAARDFLDVAERLALRFIHYHEILRKDHVDARCRELEQALMTRHAKVVNTRHIRDYSKDEAHFAFDIEVES